MEAAGSFLGANHLVVAGDVHVPCASHSESALGESVDAVVVVHNLFQLFRCHREILTGCPNVAIVAQDHRLLHLLCSKKLVINILLPRHFQLSCRSESSNKS